jgi:hypothetical protein
MRAQAVTKFSEFIPDPNGSAYTKKETRVGPPLDYVAEKMRFALESLHELINNIKNEVPDNLDVPDGFPGNYSVKKDGLLSPSFYALDFIGNCFFKCLRAGS